MLDSQSTINVFSNMALLKDIHESDTTIRTRCNAGGKLQNSGGICLDMDGFGTILKG